MSIKKNITIDGMEVPFKASAAVPRLYRLKFRRDIYKDFASLKTDVEEGDENKSELDIESLEVFENIAYIMAKHAGMKWLHRRILIHFKFLIYSVQTISSLSKSLHLFERGVELPSRFFKK